jgi:hypothetical protein
LTIMIVQHGTDMIALLKQKHEKRTNSSAVP